ncbi:MAG: UDP-N-acetylmuramoyl-tripeptide--D-alanyl-D-alanine ligase [Bdellovibrionales bacterium]
MNVEFFEKHFNVKLGLNLEKFSEVSTDTRTVQKGALFIALKGENFDGNKFAKDALDKGAAVALVSDKSLKGSVVCVEDTLKSFQGLAKAWQDFVKPKVVGITGSNGKTTSKFFTAQILEHFFKVSFSPKSFNNEIGVPITQTLLKEGDQVLVSEIGTNAKGEIKELTGLVEPHIAVVTTVGPSHLEGFGTVDNVALEKSEIYRSKNLETAIFNLDNKWTLQMYESFKGKKISFSTKDSGADICLKPIQVDIDELHLSGRVQDRPVDFTCAVFGEHNAYNVMTALAVGVSLGVDVNDLVSKAKDIETPWGRSQILKSSSGGKVLFDGYNSNMQSMEALFSGVEPLIKSGKRVHLILGEMLELGDETVKMHKKLGRKAGLLKVDSILFIGPSFKHFKEGVESSKFRKNLVISNTYNDSLAIDIQNVLDPKDIVVLKGSRGMKLERFFNVLGL